jgi:hypothetical protein
MVCSGLFVESSMTSNSPSPVGSWVLFAVASLVIVHALGETFGTPGIIAGTAAMAVAALWLHRQSDPLLSSSARSFVKRMERKAGKHGRRPPPDDADGSAPVTSPVRPRPILTGGAAKAIPSEPR